MATCSRCSSISAGELLAELSADSEASASPRQSESAAQLSDEERIQNSQGTFQSIFDTRQHNQTERCTRATAESWSSAVSSLRPAGCPSCLARREQIVLLQTADCFWGAHQAAEPFPTADTGAEAAAPVSGAACDALVEQRRECFRRCESCELF